MKEVREGYVVKGRVDKSRGMETLVDEVRVNQTYIDLQVRQGGNAKKTKLIRFLKFSVQRTNLSMRVQSNQSQKVIVPYDDFLGFVRATRCVHRV